MKSKHLEDSLEIARQHVLQTRDTASDTVDKYWEQFGFDKNLLTFLAKRGFASLLTEQLRSPGKPQITRSYLVESRPSTPVEQSVLDSPTTTYKHSPILTVRPSKNLTNVAHQILNNVALEGANGRRTLLRDFTVVDCDHYIKTQTFVLEGIQRKRQVVQNIKARLKHFGVKRVEDLPPAERTHISREWKNAEKGVESMQWAAAKAVGA